MSNGHDVERAYVQSMIALQQERLDRARALMTADLDRLRADWSASFAAETERVAEGMQRAQADHQRWLESLYDGGTSQAVPTDPQGQVGASAGAAPAASKPGPGQPDPRVTDQAEAARIGGLSMAEFQRERGQLIRATRPRGMFG